jgi:hypothetical protein
MSLNVNQFLAQVSAAQGFAKQNRYDVLIPAELLGKNSTAIFKAITVAYKTLDKPINTSDWMTDFFDADLNAQALRLTAFCEKSELPSYQFQLETVRHYGPTFKIPHMPEYQDTTMTFMCGSDMLERYFFDAWMYLVMDPISNDFNYKNEYAAEIEILQYKESAEYQNVDLTAAGANYTVYCNYYTKLIDAFPIAINVQDIGYDTNNSIQKVSVTFSYKFAVPYLGKGSTTGTSIRGNQAAFQDTVSLRPPPPPL